MSNTYYPAGTQATPSNLRPGDVVTERLWTDHVAWLVVSTTAESVRLSRLDETRTAAERIEDENCDKGAHGQSVVWYPVDVPDDWQDRVGTKTVRLRRDGTLRIRNRATPLRHPRRDDRGRALVRYDERF